jgi:hypothetical protein
VKSRSVQNDLRRDVDDGKLTGKQFVDRDAEGTRWNRISRAAGFGAGVFALGVGIVWEIGSADEVQSGPKPWTPAEDPRPIFPPAPRASAAAAPPR